MLIRNGLGVAVLAVVLGACGNSAVPGTPTATGEAPKKDQAAATGEARGMIKITSCTVDRVAVTANIEITNNRPTPAKYYGDIHFKDGSGTLITDGLFNSGVLNAGETKTKEVPGQNLNKATKVTCEVGDVKAGA